MSNQVTGKQHAWDGMLTWIDASTKCNNRAGGANVGLGWGGVRGKGGVGLG